MATGFPDYSIGFVGAITVPSGGTGLSTVVQGGLLFGQVQSPLGVLAPGADGQFLTYNATSQQPTWNSLLQATEVEVNLASVNSYGLYIKGMVGQVQELVEVDDHTGSPLLRVSDGGTTSIRQLSLTNALTISNGGTGASACTAGEILVGTGSQTAAFLNPPGARVYNSTDQTVLTNSDTTLTFDSERYNDASMHSTGTNPSRLTAPIAGVYMICVGIELSHLASDQWSVSIIRNGSETIAAASPTANGTADPQLCLSTLFHLAANDYVEVSCYQNSGSSGTAYEDPDFSVEFSAQWLRT